MKDSARYVRFSAETRRALAQPQFLIEVGGVLYLTVGVLEYDEEQGDERQRRFIQEVRGELGAPMDARVYDACPIKQLAFGGPRCLNTEPPCPDPE